MALSLDTDVLLFFEDVDRDTFVRGARRLAPWHAGIDLEAWPDLAGHPKDVDVLLYDKVRWRRDELEAGLIAPILRLLGERGLRCETVRYGQYDLAEYRSLLARSRSM